MQNDSTEKRGGSSLQPDCSARALAATIAAALFTSGEGKRASRLHFILESGEVWGGWSEPAAANHIAKIIEAQNSEIRHGGPETPELKPQRNPPLPASNG